MESEISTLQRVIRYNEGMLEGASTDTQTPFEQIVVLRTPRR